MRTRDAVLPDAEQIHALIAAYSGDGTLLPRSLAEICENVRDFVVLEHDGRIIGCGALHLYGVHLAEIRSITVDPARQSSGGGRRLVKALLAQAEKHKVSCVCPVSYTHLDVYKRQFIRKAGRGQGGEHPGAEKNGQNRYR